MEKEKRSLWSRLVALVAGFIYISFGFLMIQNPNTTLSTLSVIMGWTVTISGIMAIIYAVRFKNDPEIHSGSLFDGMLLLILGLMFLFGNFIDNTLVLAYLLVFWIIIDSAAQLQFVALLPSFGLKLLMMIVDTLIIAYGLYMLFNPHAAESFLVFYLGFGFISTGLAKFIKAI